MSFVQGLLYMLCVFVLLPYHSFVYLVVLILVTLFPACVLCKCREAWSIYAIIFTEGGRSFVKCVNEVLFVENVNTI